MKHTPGPWVSDRGYVWDKGGNVLTSVLDPCGNGQNAEPTIDVQRGAYGHGVHMDQYGRPVYDRDLAD